MAKGHDHENAAERDESVADPQANQEQRAAEELDERNRYSHEPKRPNRQKGIGKWQEILSGVLQRTQLKDLPEAGHKKDQAENEPGEKHSPATVPLKVHSFACMLGEGLGATLLLKTLSNCILFSSHW